jgi:hypothetical protein
MHSLKMLSMLSLLALSPSSCTPEQIDSFCQLYNVVILEKGDGKIVASDGVKKRLLENELTYKSLCPQGTT